MHLKHRERIFDEHDFGQSKYEKLYAIYGLQSNEL